MNRKILVIVEHKDGQIKNVSKEILSHCNVLGKKQNFTVHALVYGDYIEEEIYKQIGSCGIKSITSVIDEELRYHNPLIMRETLTDIIEEINPELIIFGNTSIGKDLSPWLAQYFDTNMVSDVMNINFDNEDIVVSKPIYGGKLIEKVKILNKRMTFLTIRPNALEMHEGHWVEPIISNATINKKTRLTYIVRDVLKKAGKQLPINEAEIIVAGGRALKKKENFRMLEDLAKLFGATVGASRPIIDLGIMRRSLQIGQSGKSVSPRLIFVCGISGQIQFVAGIANAGTVISINKDRTATIFKTSNYGLVGDVFEIVPLLTKELEKRM